MTMDNSRAVLAVRLGRHNAISNTFEISFLYSRAAVESAASALESAGPRLDLPSQLEKLDGRVSCYTQSDCFISNLLTQTRAHAHLVQVIFTEVEVTCMGIYSSSELLSCGLRILTYSSHKPSASHESRVKPRGFVSCKVFFETFEGVSPSASICVPTLTLLPSCVVQWRLVYTSSFSSGSFGGSRPGPPFAGSNLKLGQVRRMLLFVMLRTVHTKYVLPLAQTRANREIGRKITCQAVQPH
jgi:hypothetical protein